MIIKKLNFWFLNLLEVLNAVAFFTAGLEEQPRRQGEYICSATSQPHTCETDDIETCSVRERKS